MSVRWFALGLLAALLAAGAGALGFWQLDRAEQKTALLARWESGLAAPTQALSEVLATLDRAPPGPIRVAARGQFDAGATVLLDNQQLDGRAGVMVYTRFVPAGSSRALLVNRGWLELAGDRRLPAIGSPAGEPITIEGLLIAPPTPGLRLDNPRWQRGAPPPLLLWLDLDALRAEMDPALAEAVLLLDPDAPFGFTRRWRPLPNTLPPERHRGYAVQWFGLGSAVIVTFLVLAFRAHRR